MTTKLKNNQFLINEIIEQYRQPKSLQNKIGCIFGLPGCGKTMLAMTIASTYYFIYSNFKIRQNGIQVNNQINSLNDIENIEKLPIKGILVIDEGGINVNARNSMSKANKFYGNLTFLSRKKNIDIIVISQLERSVDIVLKEMSQFLITMDQPFKGYKHLMFQAILKNKNMLTGKEFYIGTRTLDLIQYMKNTGFSYDSEESSKIF